MLASLLACMFACMPSCFLDFPSCFGFSVFLLFTTFSSRAGCGSGVGDPAFSNRSFSAVLGSSVGGEARCVKNNDAPWSSLVIFSVFSIFFIDRKVHV